MAQIYPDMLDACQDSRSTKTAFDRIIVKTRFENFSDYIWERLNMLRNSFIFNLDESTWVNYRETIHNRQEITGGLLLIIDKLLKFDGEIELTNRRTGESVPINDSYILDGIFNLYKYQYLLNVDDKFSRSFKPTSRTDAMMLANGCDSRALADKQKAVIKSIADKQNELCREENELPKYFVPNKNIMLHSAVAILTTACTPNYNYAKVRNVIDSLECINNYRKGRLLDNINIKDVVFCNDVSFSNIDYRVMYDILKLFGFIRIGEECETRDFARYMRSVHSQAKNVDMLCIYHVLDGISGSDNHKIISGFADCFMRNDDFIMSNRLNADYAFSQ